MSESWSNTAVIILVCVLGWYVTRWYLQRKLDSVIDLMLAVAEGIFYVLLIPYRLLGRLFIRGLASLSPVPRVVMLLLSIVGVVFILWVDTSYNTRWFAEDATDFYRIVLFGKGYWFTIFGLLFAAIPATFTVLYTVQILWEVFCFLLDRDIGITLAIYR